MDSSGSVTHFIGLQADVGHLVHPEPLQSRDLVHPLFMHDLIPADRGYNGGAYGDRDVLPLELDRDVELENRGVQMQTHVQQTQMRVSEQRPAAPESVIVDLETSLDFAGQTHALLPAATPIPVSVPDPVSMHVSVQVSPHLFETSDTSSPLDSQVSLAPSSSSASSDSPASTPPATNQVSRYKRLRTTATPLFTCAIDAIEHAPDLTFITSPRGLLIYISPHNLVRQLGRDPVDLTGQHLQILMHSGDVVVLLRKLKHCLETETPSVPARLITTSNTFKWALVTGRRVVMPTKKASKCYVFSARLINIPKLEIGMIEFAILNCKAVFYKLASDGRILAQFDTHATKDETDMGVQVYDGFFTNVDQQGKAVLQGLLSAPAGSPPAPLELTLAVAGVATRFSGYLSRATLEHSYLSLAPCRHVQDAQGVLPQSEGSCDVFDVLDSQAPNALVAAIDKLTLENSMLKEAISRIVGNKHSL